jgi:iron complex outermembrane receptor protein
VTKAGLSENVNIRGIGIASGSPAVANGVATYVDGVFQPPIVSANVYFDIANVEVLRGPQGTLVGSNSTGGAIFITSRNPSLDRVKGYAELGAGNYGGLSAQGALDMPVSADAGSLNDRSGRIGLL